MDKTCYTPLEKYSRKHAINADPTRKEAINANCQICVGGDVEKGWRERIRNCEVMQCHLRPWRPYK